MEKVTHEFCDIWFLCVCLSLLSYPLPTLALPSQFQEGSSPCVLGSRDPAAFSHTGRAQGDALMRVSIWIRFTREIYALHLWKRGA